MTSPATRTPVLFIHGLWLHASSWTPWVDLAGSYGYDALAPGWPGDSDTPAECRKNPDPIGNRGIAEITDHFVQIIAGLPQPPIVIGHSFGGLIAQRLLGMGVARGGVAIAPAQFRGVYRLPLRQLRTAWPVLGHPATRKHAVSQSADQFATGFANAVSRTESDEIWTRYAIPAPALPLFEAGTANFSRKTPATVDTARPRGPLLIIAGGADRTVPEATVRSAFRRYRKSSSITEFKVFDGRSHSQPVDSGWRDVADASFAFLRAHGLTPAAAQDRAER